MHVKGRDGGLYHGLGIIYQTLIQMTLSSIIGQTYGCVCVWITNQNFHYTKDGT